MAKDAATGPVSRPEGGHYESSEEIREKDSGLTRSEIINAFGEDLGNKILDGGFSSLTHLSQATDEEILGISGIGPASLVKIREMLNIIPIEAPEEEVEGGLEEETPDAPEVEETVAEEEAAVDEVAPEIEAEVEEAVVEEGQPEEEAPAGLLIIDDPIPAHEDEVKFGEEGAVSVRQRRIMEAAKEREAEEQRQSDAIRVAETGSIDLGSVGTDFVPEGDIVEKLSGEEPQEEAEGNGDPEAPAESEDEAAT